MKVFVIVRDGEELHELFFTLTKEEYPRCSSLTFARVAEALNINVDEDELTSSGYEFDDRSMKLSYWWVLRRKRKRVARLLKEQTEPHAAIEYFLANPEDFALIVEAGYSHHLPISALYELFTKLDFDIKHDESRLHGFHQTVYTRIIHWVISMTPYFKDPKFTEIALELINRFDGWERYRSLFPTICYADCVPLLEATMDRGMYESVNDVFHDCCTNNAPKCLEYLFKRGLRPNTNASLLTCAKKGHLESFSVMVRYRVNVEPAFRVSTLRRYPRLFEACVQSLYTVEQLDRLVASAQKCIDYNGPWCKQFIEMLYPYLDFSRCSASVLAIALDTPARPHVECKRDLAKSHYRFNMHDLLTLEEVPENDAVTVGEGEYKHCFSRQFLNEYMKLHKDEATNPFTGVRFTEFERLQMKVQRVML